MREQRITTVEQLDALPDHTVLMEKGGDDHFTIQKRVGEWWPVGSDFGWDADQLVGDKAEYNVLWSPPVHDPSLDVSELTMIGSTYHWSRSSLSS